MVGFTRIGTILLSCLIAIHITTAFTTWNDTQVTVYCFQRVPFGPNYGDRFGSCVASEWLGRILTQMVIFLTTFRIISAMFKRLCTYLDI